MAFCYDVNLLSGEAFALLAAIGYGLAGVTIVKGKVTARFDNGLFLSVLMTTILTGILWVVWGQVPVSAISASQNFPSLLIFALAGVFSTVLGRMMMYRATEAVGPVVTSLLRRMIPVFALPLAFLLLGEVPDMVTLAGACLVIAAVVMYGGLPSRKGSLAVNTGLMLGLGSAFFYAAAYTLRSYGLDSLPDAALGTFVGGLSGTLWFLCRAVAGPGRVADLLADRGYWQLLTALSLSAGQFFQFLALKSTSVVAVATLGTLEVFFSAFLGALMIGSTSIVSARLIGAAGLATLGVMLVVW